MHYSIIPYEAVFTPDAADQPTSCQCVTYQGVKMDVIRGADGTYTIERLYSTNPGDYLNRQFEIGRKITLS